MPRPSKKAEFNFDRLNQRATSEFIPVTAPAPELLATYVPLNAILPRPGGDTRPINSKHVAALIESIAILGLITPLAVDQEGQLLAGGHRLAALQALATDQPELFSTLFPNGVPVHVIPINASTDSVNALQIEVEENTQRRNFTATEIREAAKRLEAVGYERLRGRPKPGQKSLKRELASVFRLSEDRIQRILNQTQPKGRRTPIFSVDTALSCLEQWIDELSVQEEPEWVKTRNQMSRLYKQLKQLNNLKDAG